MIGLLGLSVYRWINWSNQFVSPLNLLFW